MSSYLESCFPLYVGKTLRGNWCYRFFVIKIFHFPFDILLSRLFFWKSLIFFILRNYLDDEGSLAYILLPNNTSWLIETLASWLTDLLGYLTLNWHEFYPNKSPARLVSNNDSINRLVDCDYISRNYEIFEKKVTCFPNLQLKKYVQTVY